MKLGYSSATAGLYDLDEIFRFASELSLDFVELNFDTYDFLPSTQQVKDVLALKRATGINLSLHLPFVDINIASLMKEARKAAVCQTQRGLEYAEAIGASCAVLHTGQVFLYQPVSRDLAFATLHQSLSELDVGTVPIALENLAVFEDGLIREPAGLLELSQETGFANCLDFGHAHIEACRPWRASRCDDDLILGYIRALGQNIIHLHLCNNNGQDDLHTATTNGTIDFERYSDYLSSFAGTVCLEVAGGKPEVIRSVKHIRSLMQVAA